MNLKEFLARDYDLKLEVESVNKYGGIFMVILNNYWEGIHNLIGLMYLGELGVTLIKVMGRKKNALKDHLIVVQNLFLI